MITALQELINHISICQNENFISDVEYVKEKAILLLAKEKKQISDAVLFGIRQEFYDGTEEVSENYYLTHYTTDLNVDEIAKDRFESENEISEKPNVEAAIHESAKLLIEATAKAGFKNPELDCKLSVDDGRVYNLKFERVDAG